MSTMRRYIAQPFGVMDEVAEWTGDPADLPAEWFAAGALTITEDGTLLAHDRRPHPHPCR